MPPRSNALFVLAAALVAATAGAQPPDLGGRWTLVVESPASSEGAPRPRIPATAGGGWGREITITPEAGRITIERHQFVANDMQPPMRYVYALGGPESRNVVDMGLGPQEQVARAALEDGTARDRQPLRGGHAPRRGGHAGLFDRPPPGSWSWRPRGRRAARRPRRRRATGDSSDLCPLLKTAPRNRPRRPIES